MSRSILAIDFDGTLVDHRFPKIGTPAPGAFDWLKRFQAMDALLILLTMRSDDPQVGRMVLSEAVEFCKAQGVTFRWVNDNAEQGIWTSSRKVYAHHYIDDAAIGTPLIRPAGFESDCVDWSVVGPKAEALIIARREGMTK